MSESLIHPSASIANSARLAAGIRVGAFAVIAEEVDLGEDCVVHAHAVVSGPSRFGAANVFHSFCVIGGEPQDYTFAGERTELIAGDKNIFREYVTVSRGTKKRRRYHAHWRREFFSGVLAHRARLPDWQQQFVCERCDAGGACDD